ncbi:hypothetical protein [Brevibacterium aurantiacum]|uniref:NnrS family protein n=1 Tax=Brevibacterium aurantiacum TaxID=273384 RepID=A0A2A3YSV1_BREAU|nr:hypothetical protein [Brevibacterium aurantiacum]PCC42324.1 hypothetical protein CIK65_12940 [Brevibacterium aurantiacum]
MTRRLAFLVPAALSLLAGLDAALILLGLGAPVMMERLPGVHGILMVFGFVATLISLERAVALALPAGFLVPALIGLGTLAVLSPLPLLIGQLGLLAGALAFVVLYVPLYCRNGDEAILVQALGAVLAACAVLMWFGGAELATLIPWLAGFVIFTIAAERLELARIAIGAVATRWFLALITATTLAVLASLLWPSIGYPIFGITLLGLVSWLVIHDVARKTVRSTGQTRFMGVCLLAGYVWLAVAGLTWALGGPAANGGTYDAVVHSVFLGFTVSMIIAHSTVILPAVLRVHLPYRRGLYIPVVLLHLSLIVRIGLGDGFKLHWAWQVGGVLNILALLGFAILAAASALIGTRARSSRGERRFLTLEHEMNA